MLSDAIARRRDLRLIDEKYEAHRIWIALAEQCTYLWSDLGCWRAGDPNQIVDHTGDNLDGEVWLNDESRSKRRNSIHLHNFRYDPAHGQRVNGITKIVSEKVLDDGRSYTIDRSGYDTDEEATQEFNYTLRDKLEEGLTQNYRAWASVKSSAKASASVGVAEAEASVESEAGFEASVGAQKSRSYEIEDSDKIIQPFHVKAGKKVLAVVQKTQLITETPYTINGVLDFDITVDLENWAGKGGHGYLWTSAKAQNRFTFEGVDGYLRFLAGYDLRFKRMGMYPARVGQFNVKAKDAWDWLMQPTNRMISAKGVSRRTFENNANLAIRNIA